jgi:hypothetical protein
MLLRQPVARIMNTSVRFCPFWGSGQGRWPAGAAGQPEPGPRRGSGRVGFDDHRHGPRPAVTRGELPRPVHMPVEAGGTVSDLIDDQRR